jgi:addiction module HigA family antidote
MNRGNGTIRLPNVHPGEVLRDAYLIPLGKTPYWLGKGIGMSSTAVGQILRGQRRITPETALRLSSFFGASAQFWLNLQAAYDLEEAQLRVGDALAGIERFHGSGPAEAEERVETTA